MFSKIAIFCHTQKSFSEGVYAALGKGREHAKLLYSHWMRFGSLTSLQVEKQALALLDKMREITDFTLPECVLEKEEGEAKKFLLRLSDGLECESVIIPMRNKVTLCISSQIGCRMGCAFCETGRMGLMRHLKVEEIIAQVFYARHFLKAKVSNIVFMGMGEPLDNFDAVMQAIAVLTDSSGFGFGPSRITVSTSGLVEGIDRITKRADPALNLAVSVNSPNDLVRNRLMPVNRKWDMQALREAMLRYTEHPRRKIFIEYVLLRGVNDSIEAAEQLARYLEGIKVKVNLIPYNPQSRDRFAPPDEETTERFWQHLKKRGFQTLLRQTKGQKIRAACGQLGNVELRKKRLTN